MLEKYIKRRRPVISQGLVEKIGEAPLGLEGGTAIRDLRNYDRGDEVPEGLKDWVGAIRRLKPRERVQVTSTLDAVIRSGRVATIDELRETPDESLESIRQLGRPRIGLLRALFGVKKSG